LQFTPEFVDSVIGKIKSKFDEQRNEYYAKHKSFLNRKNSCERKLSTVEDRLIDETLSKEDYTRIKDEIKATIAGIDKQINGLDKVKEVNIDIVSEIISLTKDIYNVYMRSPEPLQKKFIGMFFDRFEVKDGVIIKYCYSPLFEGLMHFKVLNYKTSEFKKPIENNVDSNFIITPNLGD
jgi:hypothetical protein